jgi:hypothetical protein
MIAFECEVDTAVDAHNVGSEHQPRNHRTTTSPDIRRRERANGAGSGAAAAQLHEMV